MAEAAETPESRLDRAIDMLKGMLENGNQGLEQLVQLLDDLVKREAAQHAKWEEFLRQIAERDDVELMLDPLWAKRESHKILYKPTPEVEDALKKQQALAKLIGDLDNCAMIWNRVLQEEQRLSFSRGDMRYFATTFASARDMLAKVSDGKAGTLDASEK